MKSTENSVVQQLAKLLSILFFLLNNVICFSQTNISGGNVSGTWTAAGSPFQVNGEITVANGTSLTIEPGATIEFQGHYKLIVEGVLLAEGTESDSILFTVNDTTGFYDVQSTTGGWHGIRFENNTSVDSSKLIYCKMQFGKATDGDDETTTDDDKGGAIFVDHFSKLIIEHCLIDQNKSAASGGGIYVDVAEIIIKNNTITNNEIGSGFGSDYSGGGICCDGNAVEWGYVIKILNNIIMNNHASWGGGIYVLNAKAVIQDNRIDANYGDSGGGLLIYMTAGTIERNKIRNNSAVAEGGGIYFKSAEDSTVFNTNLIANNTAWLGAGIRQEGGSLNFVNNTIVNNSSEGIYTNYGDFNSTNCIIYNNGKEIQGANTLNYCAIEGGYTGTGNMDIDPGFVSPSAGIGIQPDALDADYSLTKTSDLINAGIADTTGLGISLTDLAGNERVYAGYIDIGAFELNERAEKEGIVATDITWKGDTLDIIGDIYIEDGSKLTIYQGTVLQFMGHYKIDVQGALVADGTETDSVIFTYHDTTGFHNQAVPDGGWLGIKFNNTPATNDSSIFKFCRIEFSKANDGTNYLDSVGGAFAIDGFSKIRIDSSLIQNNYGHIAGGAIYVADANPSIFHTFITNNKTSGNAGGIFMTNASPEIRGNAILYNEALNTGGVECYNNSHAQLTGNLVSNNYGGIYGGGLRVHTNSNPAIENNVISNNGAQYAGGIYIADNSNPAIINNSIVNNDADEDGGGIYFTQNSSPTIRNAIVYGNTANIGNQVYLDDDESDPSFIYCNIEEGLSGFGFGGGTVYEGTYENNYDFSPGFVSPSAAAGTDNNGTTADWSLLTTSSSLNAGDPNTTGLPDYDKDGNERIYGGRVDLGAYELQQAKEACGTIAEDAFWIGDTVKITCETTVPAGVTLTINPGTVVDFTDYYKLIVNGIILAEGTETDSIIFTTNDPVTGYHGIRFESNASTDSSKFSYCKIEYGKATGVSYEATGGAIYSNGFDLISIENCSFFNNSASSGGAIYLRNGASPVIRNSKFINNESIGSTSGGAICFGGQSTAQVINNLFANNAAGSSGGAMVIGNSDIVLTNNTIVNNTATSGAGAIWFNNTDGSDISVVKNCIIYGNTAPNGNQFSLDAGADPDIYNCNIEGGSAGFYGGPYGGTYTNNIDADPVFTDPNAGVGNQADAWSSDWSLQTTSPCINTGLSDTTGLHLPAYDMLGNPRVINNIIDMGAYESKVVPACGNISSNTDWDSDTVKVNCDITIDDSYTLTIHPGTVVEFQDYYNITVNGCIKAEGTALDSITFTVSDTTGFADTSIVDGGWAGIIYNSTATSNDSSKFAYCHFEFGKACTAGGSSYGGALNINDFSKISIAHSCFKNNMASGMYAGAGAVGISASNIYVANCLFVDNVVKGPYYGGGGAINIANASPDILNSRFFNNVADSSSGGAIYIRDNAMPHLVNNLFANNYARFGGAILFASSADANFYNNTIAHNESKFGGGIACYENSNPVLKNNIIYANADSAGGAQVFIFDNASSPDFSYNNIQGGKAGFDMPDTVTYTGSYVNNIDADPLFVNPTAGAGIEYDGINADWALQADNPCINAGTPDTTGLSIPTLDLAGEPRVFNDVRVDIGAFEYRNNHPEINTQSFDVDENSTNTTLVGTCVATDIDGDNFTFSITSGNTNSAFAIDNDGNINVNNSSELDYENVIGEKFDLTIQIEDDGIGTLLDTAIVTLNLNDVNDAPVLETQTFTIEENSNNGTIVGSVSGTDEDSPVQSLYYFVSGGTFAIDSVNGQIKVADSTGLNYEANSVVNLSIQIKDNGIPAMSSTTVFTINLNDVNEAPVFPYPTGSEFDPIDENIATGTDFGRIWLASDPDRPAQTLIYSIIGGNDNMAFAIDSTTAHIIINESDSIDYEKLQYHNLIIKAEDDDAVPLSDTCTVGVPIHNINDNAPVFNDITVTHSELAPENQMIVEFVTTDVDELGGGFTYSFVSGNENDIFYLQSGNSNRLYFTSTGFQNYLNYEDYQSFDLVIAVSDGDSITEANVTVNIEDVNEAPSLDAFEFYLDENASIGTLVGTVSGTDPDMGQNLSYFINSGTFNGVTPFAVDAATGQITVIDSSILNYEGSFPTMNLDVEIRDDGEPNLNGYNTATIHLNDVNEAPIVDPQTFSVYENATPNLTVATINAFNEDAGQSVSLEIIEGNEDGIFMINASSGVISIANTDSLDYEKNPTIAIVVQATDNAPIPLSDTALVTFNVINVNEPPVIPVYTFTIDENTPYETVVGTIEATDPENDPITYSIVTNNPYPPFSMNSASGEIFVSTPDSIDFEYRSQFVLTIKASDNNNNEVYSDITININDVNEAPIVEQGIFYVDEQSEAGTNIGTVVATDADLPAQNLTFSIIGGNENQAFSINASTGELLVNTKDSVDYELAISQIITVQVSDDGTGNLTSSAEITININNINDNAPIFSDTTVTHSEMAPENQMIVEFVATDVDELGSGFTYSFVSGNENDIFYLQSGNSNRLYFTSTGFQNYLNYEDYQSFDLVIAVSDGDSITEANVTVNIEDVNEAPSLDAFEFYLDENASIGTLVGTVSGTDPDMGQNLYYFINSGTFNGVTPFAVDAATGQITVIDSSILNYEVFFPTMSLGIEIRDDGEPNLNGYNTATIHLNDINEAPIVDPQSISVYENATLNLSVATISASDEDAGQSVSFEIIEGNEDGIFMINASSGVISIANTDSLDYEKEPTIAIVVQATDNAPTPLSDTALITFNVIDVNEPPVIPVYTFTIDENTPYETVVGTIEATDLENDPITYSIVTSNPYPPFSINSASGEIFVSTPDSIDFEYRSQFVLTLAASDNNYNEAYSDITININDVNEAPIVEQGDFYVEENSPANTILGAVNANMDAGETLEYSIINGNKYHIFDIDANTGELFVTNADSLNYELIDYFEITVRATDNSAENYWGENVQEIYVQDVNDAPVFNAQDFYYIKDPNIDPLVGIVTASDEDQDILFYSIESGNTNETFAIITESAEIIVQNPDQINANEISVYELIIKAEDLALFDTAVITIQLTPNGINYSDINKIVNVFPNPVMEKLHFDFTKIDSSVKIEILDPKGQAMIIKEVELNTEIDVSELVPGIYIIRITDAGKYYYGKIVKE